MNRIQPLSVLLGLALAGLCFLTMAQSVVGPMPLRVEYLAHPRDMVQISEGTPYVVPAGKILVMTGLGFSWLTGGLQTAYLKVNGMQVLSVGPPPTYGVNNTSISTLPTGLTIQAGSIVESYDGDNLTTDGRAWGYLSSL